MLCRRGRFRKLLKMFGILTLVYVGLFAVVKEHRVFYVVGGDMLKPDEVRRQTSISRNSDTDFPELNITCDIDELAASALSRAKTDVCKQQLADVACRISNSTLIPKKLPRYCPTQSDHTKGEYLGCYQKKAHFHHFVPVSIENRNPMTCVNKCLPRGYKYAGVELIKLICWCGIKLNITDRIPDKSCEIPCPDNSTSNCVLPENTKFFSTGSPGLESRETHFVKNEELRGMKPVRIVFVFTVSGRAARQIRRLLKPIYHVDHYYYIHVDSRADYLYRELLKLEAIFPNVRLAPERFATIWCGASLLQAHLSVMKTLLTVSNWSWDYYINLSETHYPIKNVTSLTMYLQKYQGGNFVRFSRTIDPTTTELEQYVECDEHMWLLGKGRQPNGITFYTGPDWICLHRDFVVYAVSGADPLVTGLRELYKYQRSPVESFFHVLLVSSKFCESWINENLHWVHWIDGKGCSCKGHQEEIDACGCSPMVIKQSDFDKTIKHFSNLPVFLSRKFDPVIDQEVLNSIDKLLGIGYKENKQLHRYWQNEFHTMDNSVSSKDVLTTTFGNSFIRRSIDMYRSCGRLAGSHLIETHILNYNDNFDSYLVKFSTTLAGNQTSITMECRFSQITHYRDFEQNGLAKRLLKLEVGTLYDTKEEIFRNYPGFVGPRSTGLTLQYCWEEGTDGRVTFTWTNPSGKAVSSLEKHIGTKTSCGVHTLETNDLSILPTGVWSIVVHSDSGEIAELQFLVLPIEHDGGSDDGKQVDEKLLISRIDELTSQFWKMEGLCSQNDLVLECPEIKVCTDEEWSSMSLDPKSDMGETFL